MAAGVMTDGAVTAGRRRWPSQVAVRVATTAIQPAVPKPMSVPSLAVLTTSPETIAAKPAARDCMAVL